MGDLADHYRTAAAGAQTSSPHQQEIVAELLAPVLEGRRVGRALDLGSGRGANLSLLAGVADRIVAADVSEEALRDGRIRHPHLSDRVDLVVLPGSGLPFETGAFDVSFCTEVLEHVADLEGTGRELERVTRGGGLLVVSTPNYRNVMGAVKVAMDRRSGRQDWDPWRAHAGGFERLMTAGRLRLTFPNCDVLGARGADYAFALGITNTRVRRRLSRYLLVRPGRVPLLASFGMQYFLVLRRR